MASSLTEDARKQANLRLLQRSINANIQDIVGSATHVVLYEYIAPQGWEKSQVEGSLFLVAQATGQYALAILNRHSTENFQVEVTKTFQLQHKEPYLIFKQSHKILGIWFHNSSERVVMASLLNQVIYNLQQGITPSPPPAPAVASTPQKPPPVPQQQQQYQAQSQQQQPPMYPQAGQPPRAAVSPLAQKIPGQAAGTPSSRPHQANTESPSQLIEPLMNSLFVSPSAATAAASETESTSGTSTPTRATIPGVALDKKSLQLALLSLIQDDRFIDLLHAQYLKVAHARAHRNNKK